VGLTEYHKKYSNYATIFIVGEEEWESSAFFNPNAFPKFLRKKANACTERLALLGYYYKLLESQEQQDINEFIKNLNTQFKNLKLKKDLKFITFYRGMTYLASLHGILISLKSLFDVVCPLWAQLIYENCKIQGFHKKKVNGKEISGGRFINWLRNSAPSSFHNAEKMALILEENSLKWITKAVRYRDTLVHTGQIEGVHIFSVLLKEGQIKYSLEDIIMPEMPDGTLVKDYCRMLVDKTHLLFTDVMILLPNVNTAMLSSLSNASV